MRLNFSLVLLYDCHCNFLYERFHLSERLCAPEEATRPFIGEHQEKTFGNELVRSKGDPQTRTRPINARVASNATEISNSHPPFDIGNSSHFRDVHLIGAPTLYVPICV